MFRTVLLRNLKIQLAPQRAWPEFLSLFAGALFFPAMLWAGVSGSLSGTVHDARGAVIAGATVMAVETRTGAVATTTTDVQGFYTLPALPVGQYDLEIASAGFASYRRTGIALDADGALIVDAQLAVGRAAQTVRVQDEAVHIETASSQMGQVIRGRQIVSAPLDGRSFTDLLALQPGVAPQSSLTSTTVQDVGVSAFAPSGDLNPGTVSINGQREFANAFLVNGSDVEEDVNMGTAILPNLDSIAEFRILTSNFDAEYGEFSGGQIHVVTKSGTNALHGDVFEFLRNTALDARNYFSPTRGSFVQNQFGGTLGGPLRRNRSFFFADYQGTRQTQGVDTGRIPVPSAQDRTGNLMDAASALTGSVSGPYLAQLLTQRLGYAVTAGESYYTPGCTLTTQCVLPGAVIPQNAWSQPAQHLLAYIPAPNAGAASFATSANNQTLGDDKGALRVDSATRWGRITAYYFLDNYTLNNPYPVAQGGASVPGFAAQNTGRAQLFSLGAMQTFGANTLNEAHFSLMRDASLLGKPLAGLGLSLAAQGFTTSTGAPSIVPLAPQIAGVENLVFNNFSTGVNTNQLSQVNNTFQWIDNFTRVVGLHTFKAGVEYHYDQINSSAIAQFNGSFLFTGSETGLDFADFLLGVPSQYNQSQLNPFYGRNKYAGAFVQDAWRARENLTVNAGLRWDRIEPWYEKYNQISTFEPGRQSIVFPGAPAGILYPTDPGVRRTLAPPGDAFAPRLGFAFAPAVGPHGWLHGLIGDPGATSVRAGAGLYYTAIEALTVSVLAANAPYGTTYSSPAPPLFNDPFVTASSGQTVAQPFPMQLASLHATSAHPDANVNWAQFTPISGIPAYPVTNKIPYTAEYMFSVERQLDAHTVATASYVGTQARRLLVLKEANPGDPALCLSLSQPGAVAAGSPTCGPFEESNTFTTASGQVVQGTRAPLGPAFGSDAEQASLGVANYNALELSLRHSGPRLDVLASYTYGKSMDESSNLGEEVNPIQPSLSYALSSFDIRHNFVVTYTGQLPIEAILRRNNRWTQNWAISGITRISTGFPVKLVNNGDNSLLGTDPNGVNNSSVDEPQYTPGPLRLQHNPRSAGHNYFNTALFSMQPLGTPGNAKRRFFAGPGMDNTDLALLKSFSLPRARSLQLRLESFNTFNHAQFFGAGAVDGNISSPTFGQVVSAASPRIVQVAAKLIF
jgi:hypothetical protein